MRERTSEAPSGSPCSSPRGSGLLTRRVSGGKTAAVRDATVKEIQKHLRTRTASNNGSSIELVLAGDTHLFQALRPENRARFPWVLISGMSGTTLDSPNTFKEIFKEGGVSISLDPDFDESLDEELSGQAVTVYGWYGFGYTILEKGEEGVWEATVIDGQGQSAYRCTLVQDGDCAAIVSTTPSQD